MKPPTSWARTVLDTVLPGRSDGTAEAPPVGEVRVDQTGVWATAGTETVLDVHFDGRRIVSFYLMRDGRPDGEGWRFEWPRALQEMLDGTAEVRVVVTRTGQEVLRERVSFGSGSGRVEVVNRHGQPISFDKYLRPVVSFDTRSAEDLRPMLDAIEEVLEALSKVGIEAFLAYGTLLGAVREGRVIGNDSDADLGYVSRHEHPVDVIRESFAVQRALTDLGYRITRYSALAFKVDVVESDGTVRGLDVFGGFFMDGHLHLMGEIREEFEQSWIFPLGTARLEGRDLAAPADPEQLLAATYGPGWRVPDPAFHFEPPLTTTRRLNGWFRGLRVDRARWDRIYSQAPGALPPASPLVDWILEREPGLTSYADIGCGRGADVLHAAARGVQAVGADFQPRSYAAAAAESDGTADAEFWSLNLLEIRQVLATGALLARRPGPRVVVARHLVDACHPKARPGLYRVARMALAGGGRFYLEFLVAKGTDGYARQARVRRRRAARIVRELEAQGARVVHRETVAVSTETTASRVCRLVVEWRS